MSESKQLQTTNGGTAAVAPAQDNLQHQVFESLVLKGDISNLDAKQKAQYLERLCNSLGLNPLTQPFLPLKLNGKEVLYASRGCTDQLANVHKITREIIKTETIQDVYVATCRASMPDGRFDISTGAVTIGNKKGDDLANALMKAETKAKRRATLSLCGLGFLDESEIETIPAERVERAAQSRPATKGELIEEIRRAQYEAYHEEKGLPIEQERSRSAPQRNGPPEFTGPPVDPFAPGSEAFLHLRGEIERLAKFSDKTAAELAELLAFVDQNPQRIEDVYRKAMRESIRIVFGDDRWGHTDEGTLAYLEKFGITSLDDASRGQLEACVDDLRGSGWLG